MTEMQECVREMNSLGWRFCDKHLILNVAIDGRNHRVAVPIQRVDAEVSGSLRTDPDAGSVGAYWDRDLQTSAVGFFKKLSRAVKKAARGVSRGVKRGLRRAGRTLKRAGRRVVPRAIRRAGRRLWRRARRWARKVIPAVKSIVKSKALTGVLVAASFVPGAAAITAPAIAAQQAAKRALAIAERGYRAAKLIKRGVRNPRVFAQRAAGLAATRNLKQTARQARRGNRFALEKAAAAQRLLGQGR